MTGSGAFFLVVLGSIPIGGIIAAVMAWTSIRQTVSAKTLVVAWAILLVPYALAELMESGALQDALEVGMYTVISPLAGIGLLVGTMKKITSHSGSQA